MHSIIYDKNLISSFEKIKKDILESPKKVKDLEDHVMFHFIGDLIEAEEDWGENFELDFEFLLQKIESNRTIFKFIQYIDYWHKEFENNLDKNRILLLLKNIFRLKDTSNYNFPEYSNLFISSEELVHSIILNQIMEIILE